MSVLSLTLFPALCFSPHSSPTLFVIFSFISYASSRLSDLPFQRLLRSNCRKREKRFPHWKHTPLPANVAGRGEIITMLLSFCKREQQWGKDNEQMTQGAKSKSYILKVCGIERRRGRETFSESLINRLAQTRDKVQLTSRSWAVRRALQPTVQKRGRNRGKTREGIEGKQEEGVKEWRLISHVYVCFSYESWCVKKFKCKKWLVCASMSQSFFFSKQWVKGFDDNNG